MKNVVAKKKIAFLYPDGSACGINNYSKHLYPLISSLQKPYFEVKEILFKRNASPLYYLKFAKSLKGYDFIHLQHEFGIFGKFGIGFAFFMMGVSAPVVLTLHELHRGPIGIKERILISPFKGKIAKVIVLSKNVERMAVKIFGRKKVVNTEHGLSKSPEKVKPYPLDKKLIIHPGFIRTNKNQLFTLEVAKKLPQYKFLFLGSGKGDYYSEMKKALNEIPNAKISGYVSDKEYLKIFGSARLVLMPYVTVAQSGVLCDSLFLRKQILASNCEYFNELAAEGVIFTAPLEVEPFAKKIGALLSKPLGKGFLSTLERYALDNSFEKIAEKNLLIYKSILH